MKSRGNTGGLIVKNITIKTGTYIFYRRVFTMARFTLPRDLYHGKGALEALKTFKGNKAMICVGGGSMKRHRTGSFCGNRDERCKSNDGI